ncbi:unnamed protein product, partial [marine sediment metagenome]
FVLVLATSVMADPLIEVNPMTHDFGNVQVGSSSTAIITIMNVGTMPLMVTSINFQTGSSSEFSITPAQTFPIYIHPPNGLPHFIEVEVTFAPFAIGNVAATLEILSNDPNTEAVIVSLTGTGVAHEEPPVSVADILAFFDESVADNTLIGDGPGKSAEKRLNALRNMIEAAGDLIDEGYFAEACQQLSDAYKKTDGLPKPPDFVIGSAVSTLADMIEDLVDSGCYYDPVDFDLEILFANTMGYIITGSHGATYMVTGYPPQTDPTKVYPEEYWGEYPLYLPGSMALAGMMVTYNGPAEQIDMGFVTEVYVLQLDGSNGELINGPNTFDFTINKGETKIIPEGFRIPLGAKGLNRFIAKLYHDENLIMTEEG